MTIHKPIFLLALLAICHLPSAIPLRAGPPTTNTVTLAWDYAPGDDLTNYSFNLYSTTNLLQPKPWIIESEVYGATRLTLPVVLDEGASRFFYVTACDRRSSDTNYCLESNPSPVVSVRFLPSGHLRLTIGKGPQ